jgi:hypothetical protein
MSQQNKQKLAKTFILFSFSKISSRHLAAGIVENIYFLLEKTELAAKNRHPKVPESLVPVLVSLKLTHTEAQNEEKQAAYIMYMKQLQCQLANPLKGP